MFYSGQETKKILSFLRDNKTLVLTCTTKSGKPYILPLTYYVDENLKLYFATPKPSKKYNCMISNDNVQLVVYDDREHPTSVTIEGKVHEVQNIEACQHYCFLIVSRLWKTAPYLPTSFRLDKEGLTVMCIQPHSIKWFKDKIVDSLIESEEYRRTVNPKPNQVSV